MSYLDDNSRRYLRRTTGEIFSQPQPTPGGGQLASERLITAILVVLDEALPESLIDSHIAVATAERAQLELQAVGILEDGGYTGDRTGAVQAWCDCGYGRIRAGMVEPIVGVVSIASLGRHVDVDSAGRLRAAVIAVDTWVKLPIGRPAVEDQVLLAANLP